MSILTFQQKKQQGQKISVITCYDFSSAQIIADTNIDCVLVGDSVAMVMHGFQSTLSATLEMMCLHTAAVARGVGNKFIVTDMPFLSYRKSIGESVDAVFQLMQSGAHAVKIEGALGNIGLITHLVESGVPVMGHLGLTPQFIHTLGGYKVQGKTKKSADKLLDHALQLQEAGCFALVLECVPASVAQHITSVLTIPTIGIGAGSATDGQVLVYQDLLGMGQTFKPKFVKQFIQSYEKIKNAINAYVTEVNSGEFPQHDHSYESE